MTSSSTGGDGDPADRDFTRSEIMVTAASRQFGDDDIAFVGIGLPMVAANLAKHTHAPALGFVFESGIVGAKPYRNGIPSTISAPKLASESEAIIPMFEGFGTYLQGGHVTVGALGGAQVDRHGNLNSTVIGDYDDPDVRLPGSGGASEIASNAERLVVIMPHEPRRFPEEVDFVTSPGYVGGREGRADLGLPGGPEVVVSDLAAMRFDEAGELYVDALHPGVAREEVREATAWEIPFADDLGRTTPPTAEQQRLLHEELDPDGSYVEPVEE